VKAIDVHGFGGGFTLGVVQAGFELVSKFSREKGFGVYNTLANRTLLGDNWDSIASHPSTWEPMEGNLVFGNPPCSGFSTMSSAAFRGEDSAANDYMWELIHYAAKVAPELVIFESVQLTFRQGLGLMRRLHDTLKEESGLHYDLYHVLHNNASVGGGSTRRRYFWVASRIPFGVDHYDLKYVPTFGDLLRDLEPLALTMTDQHYPGSIVRHVKDCTLHEQLDLEHECTCPVEVLNASRWVKEHMHDGTGIVDGHQTQQTPIAVRCASLRSEPWSVPWEQGESLMIVLQRCYQMYGKLPPEWDYEIRGQNSVVQGGPYRTRAEELIGLGFAPKPNDTVRWRADRMARVITGGGAVLIWHPHLDRTLTHRELARIQGFPDSWKLFGVRHAPDLGPGWGKGVPVHAGKWIAGYARDAINGNPGAVKGAPLSTAFPKLHPKYGSRMDEYIIDFTNDYKPFSTAMGDNG
jgi:site-specific DNA-cytosine methylase